MTEAELGGTGTLLFGVDSQPVMLTSRAARTHAGVAEGEPPRRADIFMGTRGLSAIRGRRCWQFCRHSVAFFFGENVYGQVFGSELVASVAEIRSRLR